MFELTVSLLIWIIFGAIGGLLLIIGLEILIWTLYFISRSVATVGEVVALIESNSEGSTTYAPKIRFRAVDGTMVEFTDMPFSRPLQYNFGDRAKVLYHRKNFARAAVGTNFSLYFVIGMTMMMELVFLGIALLGFFIQTSFIIQR